MSSKNERPEEQAQRTARSTTGVAALAVASVLLIVAAVVLPFTLWPSEPADDTEETSDNEYAMESPPAKSQEDLDFSTEFFVHRSQALELLDSYEGSNTQINQLATGLRSLHVEDVQQATSLLEGWDAEVPDPLSTSVAESADAIDPEHLSEFTAIPPSDQDEEFLDLFIENQRSLLDLSNRKGGAGEAAAVQVLAGDVSVHSATLISDLEGIRDEL